jgi:hypothetical protein
VIGKTRQRIVDARQRLVGLAAVGQQLRLCDLALEPGRQRRIIFGLQQFQRVIALAFFIKEVGGSAIAAR